MKRFICLMMCSVVILTLCACNREGDEHTHTHTGVYSDTQPHTYTQESTQQHTTPDYTQNEQVPSEASDPSQSKENTKDTQTSSHDVSNPAGADSELSEYPFTKEAVGILAKKHSDKTDIPFEQEYLRAKSNKEIADICDEYTEKWRTISERYYKEILYYNGSVPEDPNFSTDVQMHEYIEQRKTRWQAEFEENQGVYLLSLREQYPDSDKPQAMCAAYKFDMQREFALEMIGIYEMLGEFNNQEF